jgi:nitroreductase
MMFNEPITEIIKKRRSCRTYKNESIQAKTIENLNKLLNEAHASPFNSKIRFQLIASEENDSAALKGLGTYGFIKNPAAFVVGAVKDSAHSLVDYGYVFETIILKATEMNLGTCWLGGSFSKSRFSEKISPEHDEIVPAVVAIGYPAGSQRGLEKVSRAVIGSDKRKPWETLFFHNDFSSPLSVEYAGQYRQVLGMLRLAPSADNFQPWRILLDDKSRAFHFYLQRTKKLNLLNKVFRMSDLQKIDMGIAMCHFELTAREAGLKGEWAHSDPLINKEKTEYVISWVQ